MSEPARVTTDVQDRPGEVASYRVLETLADPMPDDMLADLLARLRSALGYFPELSEQVVTLGRQYEADDARGRAFSYNQLACLPLDQRTTNVTLYHELGHLAIYVRRQRGEDHPKTSEEYCSLFAMARMPPEAVDEERVPYIGEPAVPQAEYPRIARQALEYREEKRNYIQKAKEWYDG